MWERLAPLLPPQKPRTGRPSLDHRSVVAAVLWLARGGAPWRDLPPELYELLTGPSRCRRWLQARSHWTSARQFHPRPPDR